MVVIVNKKDHLMWGGGKLLFLLLGLKFWAACDWRRPTTAGRQWASEGKLTPSVVLLERGERVGWFGFGGVGRSFFDCLAGEMKC